MVGKRLFEALKSLGINNNAVAKRFSITPQYVSNLKTYTKTNQLITQIAKEYEINLNWLNTGEGNAHINEHQSKQNEQYMPARLGYGFGAPEEEIIIAKDTFFEEFAGEIEFFKDIEFPKQTIIRLLESTIKHLQTKSVDSVKTTDESNDKILLSESLFDFITEITKDSHMTMPKQLLTELTDTLLQEAIKRKHATKADEKQAR